MVVSYQTAIDIAQVILKYVGKETARKIVKDLVQVRGNRSFRDTIARVEDYFADMESEVKVKHHTS